MPANLPGTETKMLAPPEFRACPSPPDALPADTFAVRHRAWWEACDQILRENQQVLSRWQTQASQEINAASTEAQNARARAEEAVAEAGRQAAASQLAAAQAISAPVPQPSDAQLLKEFMHSYIAAGVGAAGVLALAQARLAEYKAAIRPIPSAPK